MSFSWLQWSRFMLNLVVVFERLNEVNCFLRVIGVGICWQFHCNVVRFERFGIKRIFPAVVLLRTDFGRTRLLAVCQ